MNILNDVYKYINENNLIEKNDNIVLGVSGGADSVFILHILKELNTKYDLNLNFIICHINHLIREEAYEDLEYVKSLAKEMDIKFESKEVNIPEMKAKLKTSEEEIGREERYKFFNEIGLENFSKDNYKIATAHNLNDNTETLFLNLMRGSGLDGLRGIDVVNNNVIRPILFVDRKIIEEYLDDKNIRYVIDKTNLESDYTRNSIRNELLPFIKDKYNPNIDQTIFRTSNILKDEVDFLNNLTKKTLKEITINDNRKDSSKEVKNVLKLDLYKFNELDIALRRRILKYIINEVFSIYKNISKTNIDDAILLAYNNIGNKYMYINKHVKVSILRGIITIELLKD